MKIHHLIFHPFQNGKRIYLLFLFFHILPFLSPPAALAEASDIWRYDFRDIFYDIAFLDDQNAVIVGAMGRVLRTHATYRNLWSVRNSGTRELLTCLSFVDEKNGWAAGHGGIVLHTADGGSTWTTQRKSSVRNEPLSDIHFVSKHVGYACGSFETLIKTTDGGKTWLDLSIGLDQMFDAGLFGLHFFDEDNGFAVGEFGGIIQTRDGGKTWELKESGYRGSYFGILPLSSEKFIVYGISGKVMRSEDKGQTWEDVSVGSVQRLFMAAFDEKDLIIVGSSGTIFFSHDMGKSFKPYRHDKDITSFAGVCTHPENGFLCVGERGTIFHIDPLENNRKED